MKALIRQLYVVAGAVSLALGILGVFLPLLPTTPFVLLAAFCFSKGSSRLHIWLLHHRRFGPIITDWQNGQIIRPRAKLLSISLMVVLVGYAALFATRSVVVRAILAIVVLGVSAFIITRPSDEGQVAEREEPAVKS